ncbi:haloacid dehalogenase-like hydrolase [Streptomyces sp. 3N207]|uniref:haloacid dehalogenase-like hydrolase n=1 Tax=Streptomyces sp. 3N207 TaxID=3457417 RepID=UPI003FD19B6F
MAGLVLWDIDHTPIDTRGVGRALSAIAFEAVTSQPMRQQAKIDGITEAVIFRETAKLHGLTASRQDFENFAEALTDQQIRCAAELRERGHALPGAAVALNAFAAAGVRQTVVSGNVRPVAEINLATFGLDTHRVGRRRIRRGRRHPPRPRRVVPPAVRQHGLGHRPHR